MKKLMVLLSVLLFAVVGCNSTVQDRDEVETETETFSDVMEETIAEEAEEQPRGQLHIRKPEDIDSAIEVMTLEEKAGQLIQAERGGIELAEITEYNIGSILSGGGSVPSDNTTDGWTAMVNAMQTAAIESSSGIPLVYGIDAVHGNANVADVTVFPHNIGLGAANDPELMLAIGKATAEEVSATGVCWNFGPAVSCVQDIRWGRSYESYSENIDRVASLAAPYIIGLQEGGVSATTKHFIGDGQTVFGTGEINSMIDRGDVRAGEEQLRAVNLPAYEAAIEAGTRAVMASFNSIDGVKVHGNREILTDLLRDELGFDGLVVSDWEAIHTIAPTLDEQVALAINAGVDLLMQPYNWKEVHESIIRNVMVGSISEERLDEAVRRNLIFKLETGLFTDGYEKIPGEIGTEDSKAIAREAVAKSMVLLKNEDILPLEKDMKIYLTGPAADNVGIQCGGWTKEWQGVMEADLYGGISLKDALAAVLADSGGELVTTAEAADVVLVAIGEIPYAEMMGDTRDLSMEGATALEGNISALAEAESSGKPIVTVMVAGRPMIIEEYLDDWDAFVMAWLPGTEGAGMTDVLFGDRGFTGTLPVTWPKTTDQAGDSVMMAGYEEAEYQFKYGDGLTE